MLYFSDSELALHSCSTPVHLITLKTPRQGCSVTVRMAITDLALGQQHGSVRFGMIATPFDRVQGLFKGPGLAHLVQYDLASADVDR